MPLETPPAAAPAPKLPASNATADERAQVLKDLGPMLAERRAAREKAERGELADDDEGAAAADDGEEPNKPAEGDGEGAADDDDPDAARAAAEEAGKGKPDPKTSRGLEQVARAEKRLQEQTEQARHQLLQQKSHLDAREKEISARAARADEFERRIKTDPFGAIEDALADLPPGELEAVGKQLYARAKAASDPAARALVERTRRDRDAAREAKTATQELAELKQKLADQDAARVRDEAVSEYIGTVEAAATPEGTPLLAKSLKKDPKKTRAELRQVGDYIAREKGVSWPTPAEVAEGWEKWKEHRLREELGDEALAALKKPAGANGTPPKTTNPAAGETKRPPKTISNDLGRTTPPARRTLSRDEEIEEVKRELREGKANDGS